MTPPVIPVDGVEIYYSGKFVVLETSFGLMVRYNGDHRVDVTVPSSYKGELCGMCGKMARMIKLRFQNIIMPEIKVGSQAD